jgi:succinyl-diaminopimelate desuccinylase
LPGQSHPKIIEKLNGLCAKVEEQIRKNYEQYDRLIDLDRDHRLQIKIEILTDRPCTLTQRSDPIVQAADWSTRHLTGKEPVYAGVPGATDGTFLWARKQIPIVTMGAGDRQVPHQVDEWVNLDQLVETAKIYALAALHYLWPTGTD